MKNQLENFNVVGDSTMIVNKRQTGSTFPPACSPLKIACSSAGHCLLLTLMFCVASRADVVTDWNNAALDAIRADNTQPPMASRALAILHVSIFDAVNGISRRYESYLVASAVPVSASPEAAASAAAHQVLLSFFPNSAASFNALHARILAAIRDGAQKNTGIAWGESVAAKILAYRATDGWDAVVLPPSGGGPGYWVPTPPAFARFLLPQWGFVTPFCMTDAAQFRPPGPPALASAKYAADYNEIKSLGAAEGSTRTADQSQIALFWADGAGTETPPGHWNSIAQAVGAMRGNTLDDNARLFALLNLAMADAAICAWDAKFTFDFWRPVTAIRYGDLDGNPATEPDPGWNSFIITPPFPDYVSGHATFSGAAAAVLALFYGSDDTPFTTDSDFLPGVSRSFSSFSAAAEEAAVSRLYGGIHFRSANEDGLNAGLQIGARAFTNFLQPKGNRCRR
jgi:hypothetical protein